MTAKGRIFIEEDLRDVARKGINKSVYGTFGEQTPWHIEANHYKEIFNVADLPTKVYGYINIKLKNGTFMMVGYINATLDFSIVGEGSEKSIIPSVKKYSVKLLDKPKDCV